MMTQITNTQGEKNKYLLGFDNEFFAADELQEEMEGIEISYQRVKIPAGGGLQFELPNLLDANDPEYVSELVGVIVHHCSSNAYWNDTNIAPLCTSNDGKVGSGSPGGQCKVCQFNKFGSGFGGKGKACKNMKKVYILRPGERVPVCLTLPATSIKPFNDFIVEVVINKSRPLATVESRIRLQRVTSKDGANTYSVANFALGECFAGEEAKDLYQYAKGLKSTIKASEQQYQQALEANNVAGFIEMDNSDLPF